MVDLRQSLQQGEGLAVCTSAANTGGCSRGSLNDAVAVAQLHSITDALHGLIAGEPSLLHKLLLKDTVLPDVVLDLQSQEHDVQHCDQPEVSPSGSLILLGMWLMSWACVIHTMLVLGNCEHIGCRHDTSHQQCITHTVCTTYHTGSGLSQSNTDAATKLHFEPAKGAQPGTGTDTKNKWVTAHDQALGQARWTDGESN